MVDCETSVAQLRGDATVPVAAPMGQGDLLDGGPSFGLLPLRFLLRQLAVVAGPAYVRQTAHPFHGQSALRVRLLPDFGIDAGSPVLDFFWRPSSILRKAPLKKSTSSARSANACFSCAISC